MIVEKLKLTSELSEEEYKKVEGIIEKLIKKFPNVMVREYKTQKKVTFLDVKLAERLNFDITLGKRKNYFVSVEMEGTKAKYAIQIMKFLLDEAGVEYNFDFNGKEVYDSLRRKLKESTLLEFL
ncbi:hypothetical protein NF865_08625 [Thermococcus aggregans]|uniref:Uncharacterized protein n=1 Tax=Thermococcus aggregans TaxID=110163 RepID=A0A9E7MZK1_THEAG|nr:hypothetical protein [Thermococcus aggregans]USS41704.1 hypothetical protein NF865_08625 [Thermococcus aggregans]